jgi:hypothetical protein
MGRTMLDALLLRMEYRVYAARVGARDFGLWTLLRSSAVSDLQWDYT